MNIHSPSIVVIGGGTGTYTVLSGLRDKHAHITALLTMVDDGGSNKILRDEFGLLPTSGVRLAMVALSENQTLLRELFMYRFHQGNGISGMTFGNLFLAAVADIVGSQEKAIEQTCELLSVKGTILPISLDDVRLVATYADGSQVVGEHYIDEPHHDGRLRIIDMHTQPKAKISQKAKQAILAADMIVLGPGDFYTNTVANLVVEGVREAILQSKAQVIFIMNLMTKYGEAYNYHASDYLKDMHQYLPLERVNTVVINSDREYPPEALEKYTKERSIPVDDDLDSAGLPKTIHIVRAPIVSHIEEKPQKGDGVKRSMIRHDSEKLGDLIYSLAQ